MVWPDHWDLRRVALRDPVPVYPHSLIWRGDNPHSGLAGLRSYLAAWRGGRPDGPTWAPRWAGPG
jgi:hypothetical protein